MFVCAWMQQKWRWLHIKNLKNMNIYWMNIFFVPSGSQNWSLLLVHFSFFYQRAEIVYQEMEKKIILTPHWKHEQRFLFVCLS